MTTTASLPSFEIDTCTAGTVVYPPGGTYGPRIYREIQLILLHSGTASVEIDGTPEELKPCYVMLIRPGENILIFFDKKEPTSHRWVTLKPRDARPELLKSLERLPRVLPLSKQMNQLVDLSIMQQQQNLSEHLVVLGTLGLAAVQLYSAEYLRTVAIGMHPVVLHVKSKIYARFHEELRLRDLSEAANVSPSHLVRLFRQHEKMSPTQYLWRYRVERGIALLRTTGLSIGEIGERCGFKTSYHFARLVKKQTGCTPTEIRLRHWG